MHIVYQTDRTTATLIEQGGEPVLRVEGPGIRVADLGPADLLGSGARAAELVASWPTGGPGYTSPSPEGRDMARRFLAQWTDGPRLRGGIRIIDAYTPDQPQGACIYGPDWWLVVRRGDGLVVGRCTADDEAGARVEAAEHDAVALVRFWHVAYNVAPSMQRQADWALEAASAALGVPYREGGGR